MDYTIDTVMKMDNDNIIILPIDKRYKFLVLFSLSYKCLHYRINVL